MEIHCPQCSKPFETDAREGEVKCPRCGKDVGWDSLPVDMELPKPCYPLPFQAEEHPHGQGEAMSKLLAYRLRPWWHPCQSDGALPVLPGQIVPSIGSI